MPPRRNSLCVSTTVIVGWVQSSGAHHHAADAMVAGSY